MQVTQQQRDAASPTYRRELGNGLVLRWSTPEDTEKIVQFTGMAWRDKQNDFPSKPSMYEMHDLMRGDHPLMSSGDCGIVEDTSREGSPVVAYTSLWHNRWDYEGIPFDVGQPEMVATDPDYRNRGLVRALFEMVHARSAVEGHLVQGITGIRYFYRQFGYEYVLDLGGECIIEMSQIPKAKTGEPERYTLRNPREDDLPFIRSLYNASRTRGSVSTLISDTYWLYEIQRRKPREQGRFPRLQVIVDTTGSPVGYLLLAIWRFENGTRFFVFSPFDVSPDVNLHAAMPSLLRALQHYAEETPFFQKRAEQDVEPVQRFVLSLGAAHPVYDALGKSLTTYMEPPYAWYIRVPDLPAFLRHIAPVLERRLTGSVVANYTGELRLNFYRGGLRMVWEQGKLATVEDWRAPLYEANESAAFPPLVFLKMVFGYRSLAALRTMYPDVWASDEATILLDILFPATRSTVVPL